MEWSKLSYFALLLIYLAIPVLLGAIQKIRFAVRLPYLLPAAVFAGAIFIMLNKRFVESDIWTFNADYLSGIFLLNVPAEEWVALLLIPLSSAYIYEWLKMRTEQFEQSNLFVGVSLVFFVFSAIVAYFFRQSIVTFFIFFLIAIYLGYTVFRNRFKKHYTTFYLAYFISLIPFAVVSFISNSLPILVFNTDHIMGLTGFGVPIERMAYLFLLLLINTTIYEYLNERQYY